MRKIYLASSWRNAEQPQVLQALRDAGHEVCGGSPAAEAVAIHGYLRDWQAMQRADTGVLLLPSGRSAHIEAGYFVGADKPLFVLLSGQNEPELMYRMAYESGGALCLSTAELLEKLAALEPEAPHA